MKRKSLESDSLNPMLDEVRAGRVTVRQAAERIAQTEWMDSEASNSSSGGLDKESRADSTPETQWESVQELVNRLGRPPEDIIGQWCTQLQSIARQFESASGGSFPATGLKDCVIDSEGMLRWIGADGIGQTVSELGESARDSSDHELRKESREALAAFQELLHSVPLAGLGSAFDGDSVNSELLASGSHDRGLGVDSELDYESMGRAEKKRILAEKFARAIAERNGTTVDEAVFVSNERSVRRPEPQEDDARERRIGGKYWVITGVLVAVSIALFVAGLQNRFRRAVVDSQSDSDTGGGSGNLNSSRPGSDAIAPVELADDRPFDQRMTEESGSAAGSMQSPGTLTIGTSDSDLADVRVEPFPGGDPVTPSIELDPVGIGSEEPEETGPGGSGTSDRQMDEAPRESMDAVMAARKQSVSSLSSVSRSLSDAPLLQATLLSKIVDEKGDPFKKIEGNPPGEQMQQTRQALSGAVSLPPMSSEDVIALAGLDLKELRLDFPHQVPLTLEVDSEAGTIFETRGRTAIATLSHEAEGMSFRWTAQAKSSSASTLLAQGRLSGQNGTTYFLRPTIVAESLRFAMQNPDIRPTWDLKSALPARAARFEVIVNTPDDVEHAWIYPLDPKSPRRTVGFLMLQPKDGESVQVGVKVDVRCTRKLTCRVRTGARLDPRMTWDLVSVPILTGYSTQMSESMLMLGRQKAQLDSMYDAGDTDERRVLRPQRTQLEEVLERMGKVNERLNELRALVSRVQQSVTLDLKLWVEWPNGQQEQVLLTTIGDAAEKE